MSQKVLILGGRGRIGASVAQDILNYTNAEVIITGHTAENKPLPDSLKNKTQYLKVDLEDQETLSSAIQSCDLVIHCAGPFHYRDGRVLKHCLESGVNYVDVSDHRSFYQTVMPYQEQAIASGVTAVLNTGVFPGISNSIVRQGVEQLDEAEQIHLSYVVGGSGGAGLTVMRTTFLGLRQPFEAWIQGKWQQIVPYTEREMIQFPHPYGKTGVYWFDVPETYTFAESFPVKTVITKFGSIPDLYNHLTWITAHIFPSAWIESKRGIEFFSKVSYLMTMVSDNWSGIGVAMVAEITGKKAGKPAKCRTSMAHQNTAFAAGCGTGSVAQLILAGRLQKPGIYPVERVLPTELFQEMMQHRNITITESLEFDAE